MAMIEPLNSVMTYQAQAVTKPQAVAPVDTEVPADGQTVNVDETTAAVTKAQTEDEKGNGGDNAGSQQQASGSKQSVAQQTAKLKKATGEMNRKINNSNEQAVFGVNEDTNRIMIKIMDKETKEVIKEFPPEKTLDMIARIWEMAGILVDEKR